MKFILKLFEMYKLF